MKILKKPISITVTKNENGTLRAETNHFLIPELEVGSLQLLTSPYIGFQGQIALDCGGDENLSAAIQRLFIQQGTWCYYLDDTNEAVDHYLANVQKDRLRYKIDSLKDTAKDIPILFCGAGPSLTENIELVRKIADENKAIVIAGGTAIRILHDNNIIPHFCLAFDSKDSEYTQIFEHLSDEWMQATCLIHWNMLNTKCFDKWSSDMILIPGISCIVNQTIIEGGEPIKDGGVGVSTAIPAIASYMGCKELYYIGVDLSFTKDGKFYADTNISQPTASEEFEDNTYQIVEYNGKKTRAIWKQEAERIGIALEGLQLKAYNCSKSGLTIPNTEYVKLKKLLKLESKQLSYQLIERSLEDLSRIKEVLDLFKKELELGYILGFNSDEFRSTLVYESVFQPYDWVQRARQVWTMDYNHALLKVVADRWYRGL